MSKKQFMEYAIQRIKKKQELKEKGEKEALDYIIESQIKTKRKMRVWK